MLGFSINQKFHLVILETGVAFFCTRKVFTDVPRKTTVKAVNEFLHLIDFSRVGNLAVFSFVNQKHSNVRTKQTNFFPAIYLY